MESQKSRRKPEIRHHLVDEIVVVVREGRVVLVSSDGDLPCEPNQDINVSCGMPESRM